MVYLLLLICCKHVFNAITNWIQKCYIFHILCCLIPILGVFIPIPGVLLALLVPEWNYVINDFPPFLCSPKNLNLWYYTMNLPINILVAIGVSLLILIFWKLHKVRIIILIHFSIPCPHSIKVYFTSGKKGVLLSVQLKKRF